MPFNIVRKQLFSTIFKRKFKIEPDINNEKIVKNNFKVIKNILYNR